MHKLRGYADRDLITVYLTRNALFLRGKLGVF